MGKKKELTKYQKITIGIGIIGLIIGVGALLGTQLELPGLDPGPGGGIPIPTPTTNGGTTPPAFDIPVISLDSVEIKYLDETSFTFEVFIIYAESVTSVKINLYDDGVVDFDYSLSAYIPANGWYAMVISKSQFADYEDESIITIDVKMLYYHEILGYYIEVVEYDVVEGFSYLTEEPPPPPPPEYEAPEIIDGTFEFSVTEPYITFSFATENYELINSMSYYFMVDKVIVENSAGQDVVKTMSGDGNGIYSGSFDYTQFDLEKIIYIYLMMNFVNEDSIDEDRIYEEFSYFGYKVTPTETVTETITGETGINYIFALITTIVGLTFFTINKKKKEVMKNG